MYRYGFKCMECVCICMDCFIGSSHPRTHRHIQPKAYTNWQLNFNCMLSIFLLSPCFWLPKINFCYSQSVKMVDCAAFTPIGGNQFVNSLCEIFLYWYHSKLIVWVVNPGLALNYSSALQRKIFQNLSHIAKSIGTKYDVHVLYKWLNSNECKRETVAQCVKFAR